MNESSENSENSQTFFNLPQSNQNSNQNKIELKEKFNQTCKIQISNILVEEVAELLLKYAQTQKNWILASGFDSIKYEKLTNKQNEKANQIQIRNIQNKFKNDHFSYVFHRTMNNNHPSFLEFNLRKHMESLEFINFLNEITDLQLTKLNTLFLSKYKGGDFLSPHCDKGNGKLAFVLNLTKNWKPQYGGILHFLNEEKTEIIESYNPIFNNLILFKVPTNGIPHFVSHVVPYVKQERYAITGWYI